MKSNDSLSLENKVSSRWRKDPRWLRFFLDDDAELRKIEDRHT